MQFQKAPTNSIILEAMATTALTVMAESCVSTTRWPLKHHGLQLSGITRQMLPWALLTM